jgi:GNAT superfamily N-acetyltransferase
MADRDISVRTADHSTADAAAIARLLGAYHGQTEAEKIAHGLREDGPLPAGYRAEIDDPPAAFAGSAVYLAERDGVAIGMAVARADADGIEVKRLWVDPAARGSGAGTALLDAATAAGDGP